jgi:hypothetical protein
MKKTVSAVMTVPFLTAVAVAGDGKTTHPFSPYVEDLTVRGEPPRLGPYYTRDEYGRRLADILRDAHAKKACS